MSISRSPEAKGAGVEMEVKSKKESVAPRKIRPLPQRFKFNSSDITRSNAIRQMSAEAYQWLLFREMQDEEDVPTLELTPKSRP